MRIFFAGSPKIALSSLEKAARCHEVAGVLTNPDAGAGRGRQLCFSAVKEKAIELGLPVFQPETIDADFLETVRGLKPDLLVSVAYGHIFRKNFLDVFPRGGINLHPSLLPKYRGPSPITAAILNGDKQTGITIQTIALKMDTGDILLQKEIDITGGKTTGFIEEKVAILGAEMLNEVIISIENGKARPVPQDETQASYCSLVKKQDGYIDWNLTAVEITRRLRAYTPWPGIFTTFRGKTLKLLEAEVYKGGLTDSAHLTEANVRVGQVLGIDKEAGILIQTQMGILAASRLQLQSKKPHMWKEFLNGVGGFTGSVLGENR